MGWLLEWGPREIKALRTVRRDSHQSLGEHLGASEQTVRRWEKGGQPPTHKELLRKLDETLAALEPWRRAWFDELRAQLPAPTVDAAPNGSTSQEDEADRRQVSKALTVGLAAAALPLGAVDRIAHHGNRPVDAKLVSAYEDFADMLACLHRTCRPDVLAGPVARHADNLLALLDAQASPALRVRLGETSAEVHSQAGMLAFFCNDRPAARRYFAIARAIADDFDNDPLRARCLTAASLLYSPRPMGGVGGDPKQAARMLQEACDRARHADAGTKAWAHRWFAIELAACGDEPGFRNAMATAAALVAAVDERRGFSARTEASAMPHQLYGSSGLGLVLLGLSAEAVAHLRAANGTPRARIVTKIDTAAAHMLDGDPEQTCAGLVAAAAEARDAGYLIAFGRIRGVRARFPANWAGLACVQQLDERLRLTTT